MRLGEVIIDTPNGKQSIIVGVGMRAGDIIYTCKAYQHLEGEWELWRPETGVTVDPATFLRMGEFILKKKANNTQAA